MSNTVTNKDEKTPLSTQITILLLLALVVVFGLLNVHAIMTKEPALTPQRAEMESLSKLVKKNPDAVHPRLLLAYSYQKTGDLSNAQKQYLEVLKLDDKNLAALYNLGLTFQEQKNLKESEEYFKKTIKIKPNHVLGLLGLGEIYVELNRYEDAINVLETALTFEKQLVDLRLILAEAYEKKGEKSKAIVEYKTVLKYIPTDKIAAKALERLEQKEGS